MYFIDQIDQNDIGVDGCRILSKSKWSSLKLDLCTANRLFRRKQSSEEMLFFNEAIEMECDFLGWQRTIKKRYRFWGAIKWSK